MITYVYEPVLNNNVIPQNKGNLFSSMKWKENGGQTNQSTNQNV